MRAPRGRQIVVKHDIETRGGRKFTAGTRMFVTQTYRGRLCLDFTPDGFGLIRGVFCYDVDLVPK